MERAEPAAKGPSTATVNHPATRSLLGTLGGILNGAGRAQSTPPRRCSTAKSCGPRATRARCSHQVHGLAPARQSRHTAPPSARRTTRLHRHLASRWCAGTRRPSITAILFSRAVSHEAKISKYQSPEQWEFRNCLPVGYGGPTGRLSACRLWGAEQADNFPANVWHSSSTRKWVSLMQRVTAGVGNKLVEACARESK